MKKNLKIMICCILIFILIIIIAFLLWYREPMIRGQFENLKFIEIMYYTDAIEKESIVISDMEEMELFYNTIQDTNIEKIYHDTEWGGEEPRWSIILHFEDRKEELCDRTRAEYRVRKYFLRGDQQGIIIGTNEELYLLVDETIEAYMGENIY